MAVRQVIATMRDQGVDLMAPSVLAQRSPPGTAPATSRLDERAIEVVKGHLDRRGAVLRDLAGSIRYPGGERDSRAELPLEVRRP